MFAIVCAALGLAAQAPKPFPFPQDCSHFNMTSKKPTWYKDCEKVKGGCFSIEVPKEGAFNIGNTTFGSTTAGGVKWWCAADDRYPHI